MRGAASAAAGLAVAAILGCFLAQSVGSMGLLCATSDETTHLPSGYAALRTGQLRLNPQHPPLLKMLAAAPLLFLSPRLDLDHPAWRSDPPDEWAFGYAFLYSNDADRLLFWGRLPIVGLAVLLGGYVFAWSRDRFGPKGGLLSLFLYAFCPNVIAHSHLVTMDVGLACFFVMSLYHLRKYAATGAAGQLLVAGVAAGLALGSKFSGALVVPVGIGLLGLAALADGREETVGIRVRRAAVAAAAFVALAAVVVWAIHLFPTDPLFYWKGMMRVNADHNPSYEYYLNGEFRAGGWWHYFLVAFAVKTPLPTLLLLVASLGAIRRPSAGWWVEEAFVALPAVAFVVATSALADDLGIRYLLPAYPLIFIHLGRLAPGFAASRIGRAAAIALALWVVGSAIRIFPDHLAYFNEAVGGPGRGHFYLDDSNIDWGQDLKRLRAYLDRNGIERIKLYYGWNASPDYYGIRWDPVTRRDWHVGPSPGLYAVSTHLLIRGLRHARVRGTRSDWLARYPPVGRVGYGFYLYRFDPAAEGPGTGQTGPNDVSLEPDAERHSRMP